MKILLSAAAIGTALMLGGAGISTASAAPASKTAAVKEKSAGAVTDFSAQRRHHHGRHHHGHRHHFHGHRYGYAPRYYARPYAYRPYGGYYGGPHAYGPSVGFGPSISFGFGPRWGW